MLPKDKKDTTSVPEEKRGVLSECKHFVETSSVKGVSRIVKSQTPCLQVTWLVVTVSCVSISIYTCTDLCQQYLEYPSSVKVKVYNGWNLEEWNAVTEKYDGLLLSATLCNHKPLASNPQPLSDGVLSPLEFKARLSNLYQEVSNSTHMLDLYGKEVLDLNWQRFYREGYVQSIPLTELEKLGHQVDDFIVLCHFEIMVAGNIKTVPCNETAEFHTLLTPYYLFCYTIAPTIKIYDYGIPLAISVVLYLDSFSDGVPLNFDDTSEFGQEAGVRVIPHRQNILPRIALDGTSVSPGHHVTFDTKFVGIHRLGAPYSECHRDNEVPLFNIRNRSIKYQKEHCFWGCMEKKFLDQCACRSVASPVMLGPWPKNASLIFPCGHVFWENITKTLEAAMCMASVSNIENQKDCSNYCKPPCTELLFEKRSQSNTKWPVDSAVPGFYLSHITHKSYGYRFKEYGDIISQWQLQNSSQEDMLKKIKQPHLIEDNFVKISIEANSLDVLSYETVPAITFSSMISSVGGALNLYAGLTIIFIFEIIEFVFKIAWTHHFGFKKSNHETTAVKPM